MKKNCRLIQILQSPTKTITKVWTKTLNLLSSLKFTFTRSSQLHQLTTPKTHKTQINQSKLSTHSISRQLSPTFTFKHTQFLISHIPLSPSFQRGFFFPNFFFLSMEQLRFRFLVSLPLFFLLLASFPFSTESTCTRGCSLALGSYYMWKGSNLTYISSKLTYTSNFQKLHFFRNPFFLSLVKYQSFTLCSRLQLENCK